MSSAGGLPLPVHVAEVDRDSWTSSASLYISVWAVKRWCLSSSVVQAVPSRAALAMWLDGMDLREFGEGESPGAPSGDERMLDWIALSMKSGWTPKDVLMWIFPNLWGCCLLWLEMSCVFIICIIY